MRIYLLIGIALLASVESTPAEESIFFDRSRDGWFWYLELVNPAKKDKLEKIEKLPGTMKEIRAYAEKLLNEAIETPTVENVRAYMAYQRLLSRRAEKFAHVWQRVLWQHPELDATVENPVATFGLSLARSERARERDEALSRLSKTSGLLYFLSRDCPMCELQSSILASFSKAYGFSVIPISLDGSVDPVLGAGKVDRGAAEKLKVEKVPAIFLARPPSNILRVSTGLVAAEDLAMRLYVLSGESGEENDIFLEESVTKDSGNWNTFRVPVDYTGTRRFTTAAR